MLFDGKQECSERTEPVRTCFRHSPLTARHPAALFLQQAFDEEDFCVYDLKWLKLTSEEEFSLANISGPPSSPGTGSCVGGNCWFLPSNWKQSNFKMEWHPKNSKLSSLITGQTWPPSQDRTWGKCCRVRLRNRMIRHQRDGDSVWSPQGGGREKQGGQVKGLEALVADSRGNGWFRKEAECTDWRDWHAVRGQNWNSKKPPHQ